MQQCFIPVWVWVVLRFLISAKNLGYHKKSFRDKLVKIRTFHKTFHSLTIYLIFRIINVYQCFFALNILFVEVDRRVRHEQNLC